MLGVQRGEGSGPCLSGSPSAVGERELYAQMIDCLVEGAIQKVYHSGPRGTKVRQGPGQKHGEAPGKFRGGTFFRDYLSINSSSMTNALLQKGRMLALEATFTTLNPSTGLMLGPSRACPWNGII